MCARWHSPHLFVPSSSDRRCIEIYPLWAGELAFQVLMAGINFRHSTEKSSRNRKKFRLESDFTASMRAKTHGIRIADKSFVARKFHAPGMVMRNAAEAATMNLRAATLQMAGMRTPSRVRTIPSLRRRLHVTVVSEPALSVNIRHVVQNVDSGVNETRRVERQRV